MRDGSVIGPLLFLIVVNGLPDALEALPMLCEWCQIGNSAAIERGPSQLSYCRMRQFADKGHTGQSCKAKLPRHWTSSPPEIAFCPRRVWHPIHVFKLLKDLGI